MSSFALLALNQVIFHDKAPSRAANGTQGSDHKSRKFSVSRENSRMAKYCVKVFAKSLRYEQMRALIHEIEKWKCAMKILNRVRSISESRRLWAADGGALGWWRSQSNLLAEVDFYSSRQVLLHLFTQITDEQEKGTLKSLMLGRSLSRPYPAKAPAGALIKEMGL